MSFGRCTAITKKGTPCVRPAINDAGVCGSHDPATLASRAATRTATCAKRSAISRAAEGDRLVPGFPRRVQTREQMRKACEAVAVAVADGLLNGRTQELTTLNQALKNIVTLMGQANSQVLERASKTDATVLSIEGAIRKAAKLG